MHKLYSLILIFEFPIFQGRESTRDMSKINVNWPVDAPRLRWGEKIVSGLYYVKYKLRFYGILISPLSKL